MSKKIAVSAGVVALITGAIAVNKLATTTPPPPAALTVVGNPMESPGWTTLAPSPDSRTVYWDPANESGAAADAGDGSLAHPKRSFAAAETLLRPGFPDWLVLTSDATNLGDKITWSKSGRSKTEPMVLTTLAGRARGRLSWADWSKGTLQIRSERLSNIAFVGLHIEAPGYNGYGNQGTAPRMELTGTGDHILFEDCVFDRVTPICYPYGYDGTVWREDDVWKRCIFLNHSWAMTSGGGEVGLFYAFSRRIKLIECVGGMTRAWQFDGQATPQRISSHLAYFGSDDFDPSFLSCFAYRWGWPSGGDGLLVRAGGAIRDSVAITCSQALCASGGPVVITGNYAEDAWGVGRGITVGAATTATITGNIVAHGEASGPGYSIGQPAINLDINNITSLELRGNTVHQWGNQLYEWTTLQLNGIHKAAGPYVIAGNRFANSAVPAWNLRMEAELAGPWLQMSGNVYNSANPATHSAIDRNGFGDTSKLTAADPTASLAPMVFPVQSNAAAFARRFLGPAATADDWFIYLAGRPRGVWEEDRSPAAFIAWVRQVYASPCRCDYDHSGALNVLDYNAFLNGFGRHEPAADFDGDGNFTVLDFNAFGNDYSRCAAP